PRTRNGAFLVPASPTRWLYSRTMGKQNEQGPAYDLVHALGRHIRQERVFRLFPLAILGAAKGCGHGNHDGPRGGALREDKAVGNLAMPAFERMCGPDVGGVSDRPDIIAG